MNCPIRMVSCSIFLPSSPEMGWTRIPNTLLESLRAEWPLKETASSDSSSDQNGDDSRNSSPWTYENESLNPALRPSNSQLRTSTARRRRPPQNKIPGASSLPPYHPDYREDEQDAYAPEEYSEESGSSEGESRAGKTHVRRGSEGFEVRQEGREEMLRRYLQELGEDPDRYLRYIPQPDEDSESEDDNVPLAYHQDTLKTK